MSYTLAVDIYTLPVVTFKLPVVTFKLPVVTFKGIGRLYGVDNEVIGQPNHTSRRQVRGPESESQSEIENEKTRARA